MGIQKFQHFLVFILVNTLIVLPGAKIISAGWDGMVDRFIEIYDVLFDATSSVPVTSRSTTLIYNIGVKEGMANLGAERNEVLGVDRKIFRSELTSLFELL